jgi:hypothetical protein
MRGPPTDSRVTGSKPHQAGGQELRTPFSAPEGHQLVEYGPEEIRRELLDSFQAFQRPTFRQVEHRRVGAAQDRALIAPLDMRQEVTGEA